MYGVILSDWPHAEDTAPLRAIALTHDANSAPMGDESTEPNNENEE